MRNIKDQFGNQIPLAQIKQGILTTDKDFPDYGLKVGVPYKVHGGDYPCIFGSDGAGETRLDNNEIREDILSHLTINI